MLMFRKTGTMTERPVRATWKVVRDSRAELLSSVLAGTFEPRQGEYEPARRRTRLTYVEPTFEPSNSLVQERDHAERVGDLALP